MTLLQTILALWAVTAAASVVLLLRDLRRNNPEIQGLMRWVWILTVLYSGPLGLAGYFWAGRKQIPHDDLARRAFRSVAHCYSGCGLGEIGGLLLTVGLLGLGTTATALVTFAAAYVAGFALTIGPLMQGGESFREALSDTLWSETASIAVMEVTAIAVDLWLAGSAGIGAALFWISLVVSLTIGLVAAYPVNVLLIRFGVKEGMHSPKAHAAHAH
ncbi:DUF4396 domain-containing protein [Rhodovibrio salinarum]|uniref:DUF4396 domain-containing protein n=1 Tax=Rhodovibrio salinarum TaxID=1087 RepID=A0A934QII1_9PROT|nr:DUF4396 domain-containing protein [Rhodovibrio salinarum]MBK1697402.1 DUF4396 domain-containing protein [Rhodovibrio salinarum]